MVFGGMVHVLATNRNPGWGPLVDTAGQAGDAQKDSLVPNPEVQKSLNQLDLDAVYVSKAGLCQHDEVAFDAVRV